MQDTYVDVDEIIKLITMRLHVPIDEVDALPDEDLLFLINEVGQTQAGIVFINDDSTTFDIREYLKNNRPGFTEKYKLLITRPVL